MSAVSAPSAQGEAFLSRATLSTACSVAGSFLGLCVGTRHTLGAFYRPQARGPFALWHHCESLRMAVKTLQGTGRGLCHSTGPRPQGACRSPSPWELSATGSSAAVAGERRSSQRAAWMSGSEHGVMLCTQFAGASKTALDHLFQRCAVSFQVLRKGSRGSGK